METGSDSRHGNPPAGRGILCPGQLAADGPGNNARRENIEDDSVDIEDDPIEVEDTPDSFEALQARAAAYRSAAGCDSDGSSDDSSSDELVAAGPGPLVLSPATQALLSSPALSRMRAMGALGKRSTGRQLSPEGESSEMSAEEGGGEEGAADNNDGGPGLEQAPPSTPPRPSPTLATAPAPPAASVSTATGAVPAPPSGATSRSTSSGNEATASTGGTGRTTKPMLELWDLTQLKKEAGRQAGRRRALKYGPLPEDELKQLSNANRPQLIAALKRRMAWREELEVEPEWTNIPVGVTPQKKKDKAMAKVAKAARRHSGGRGALKTPKVNQSMAYSCRLVCLTTHEEFYDDYICYRGGSSGTPRGEQDTGAVGDRHRFMVRVARAMAKRDWKDKHGNAISVPDDHSKDTRAPDKLKILLADLDLEGAAVSLQGQLETVFKKDEPVFYTWLQSECSRWLKDVKGHHTKYRADENQSGGAGAETQANGEIADAIHPFEFMGGRLCTMLWEDGMRLVGGGDDSKFTGDVIIPDGHAGSGSSVPGGPGVRATAKVNSGSSSSKKVKKPKHGGGEAEREALAAKAGGLIATLQAAAEREIKGLEADKGDDKDSVLEGLVDDVSRLEEKVANASSERTRSLYTHLLAKANARLDKAEADMAGEGTTVSSPSEAAELPPASLPAAAAPMAVGGAAGSGDVEGLRSV